MSEFDSLPGFRLEITSFDAFLAFSAFLRGQEPQQARIDALAAKQAAANTKLAADVEAAKLKP